MEEYIYRVVNARVEDFESLDDLLAKYKQVGIVGEGDMEGHPVLKDLVEPMDAGIENGKRVVRYETVVVYEVLRGVRK